ncbi:MAG: class I tRNA ligase family protein [Patescibacteria group bacterium]|nr:class I tRNA ligase family protein [Patescibacteria group bacterium]
MSQKYDFRKIEKKWPQKWAKEKLFSADDKADNKYYCLIEFPYPSADGLHVGHLRSYTALDIIARKKRMEGKNVLFPIGFDSFGLPTENYAIKVKKQPQEITRENIKNFTRQLKSMGFSFDWDRCVDTSDPDYYKWTQWLFLKLYEAGLVYQKERPINWCPACKTGLANEEVVGGKCERCGAEVSKKNQKQWLFKITQYADRLIKDLDKVDYLEKIKKQQIDWIGKSEGAEIKFPVFAKASTGKQIQSKKSPSASSSGPRGKTNSQPEADLSLAENNKIQNSTQEIKVFTTRPDTLYGVTYLVLSPEHEFLANGLSHIANQKEVEQYIKKAKAKSDLERTENKEKTGVELKGLKAVNPVNQEEIPIFIADYVLMDYGTGAIMAVPAHDQRDFEFAKKYNLSIKNVIEPEFGMKKPNEKFSHRIVAIVRDPKNDKLLSLNWAKYKIGHLFIGGGMEEGEDIIKTAIREIKEETGYTQVKHIATAEKVRHHYYAWNKGFNRDSEARGLLFELVGRERVEQKLEDNEKGGFTVEWITKEEASKNVIDPMHHYYLDKFIFGKIYTGEGLAINSGEYNDLSTKEFKKKITQWLKKNKLGGPAVNYKLRDWIFSRQHYWGEPIPLIHCQKCGVVKVPEKDLPVKLPEVKNYEPTDTGESPLAKISDWVNVRCPKCGESAKRETDTMPNWAGSNWYFIRYCDPHNEKEFASWKKMKKWLPVDLYNGGMEHTTLHLLYSRFWYKALSDLKLVPGDEPYKKRVSHGMVLAQDGQKMSKSRGNVVNPDEVVDKFGADALRLYEMFMGPFDQAINWREDGLQGLFRFLDRVNKVFINIFSIKDNLKEKKSRLIHKTIKKVGQDIENMRFNTAISTMMEYFNERDFASKINEQGELEGNEIDIKAIQKFLIILSPFAPHLAEELWQKLGHKDSIFKEKWPSYDKSKIKEEEIEFVIQVNGKVRDKIQASPDISEKEAREKALASKKVKKFLKDEPKKVIFVKGKLINLVI